VKAYVLRLGHVENSLQGLQIPNDCLGQLVFVVSEEIKIRIERNPGARSQLSEYGPDDGKALAGIMPFDTAFAYDELTQSREERFNGKG
jgi:hypothetical protein